MAGREARGFVPGFRRGAGRGSIGPVRTSDPSTAEARILAVVAALPPGRVATYGEVAALAGLPRRARLVGRVLAALPEGSPVPWQRVVAAGGRIALAGSAGREQRRRLAAEGVALRGGRVVLAGRGRAPDLDALLWGPPPAGGAVATPGPSRPAARRAPGSGRR
jgi:methylated-DNA-protein-cysteine methyltransferase-like protein